MASILLVAAFGMIGAGFTSFLVDRDRTSAEIDERLVARVQEAMSIVTGVRTAATEGAAATPTTSFTTTSGALEAVIARVIPDRNESALGIIDGRPTLVPGVDLAFHLEDDPAFVARVTREAADGTVRRGTAVAGVGTLRYIAVPVAVEGSSEQGIYVTAIDIDAELAGVSTAFATYAFVAGLSLIAIGLVGWVVAGRLLRPIRQLSAAASRLTASERPERIPVAGHDDVSELTVTFNDMLDRLDAALDAQRRLLDDVRHELKTPITILRGHLELLDASSVGEVEATRALAIEELDRMAGLVDDIEFLAEGPHSLPTIVTVDAAEFTSEVFAKASGFANHRWVLAETAEAQVEIDPARITQAWLQLVDNAAKYSPSGSTITLGSRLHRVTVEFWVSDTGPGIPQDVRDRIFERFGRVDAGRGIEGSGLGLPIVKAIAVAHGGDIGLSSSPAGSRFGIVVPLVQPRQATHGGTPQPPESETE